MKTILVSFALALSTTAFAAPTTLTVDTTASEIKWTGSKVIGSSHNGTINMKSGTVQMDGSKLAGGEFVIDMNSINNKDLADSAKDKAKLEGHLKSDDFFGVAKHPTATFKITSAKASKKKGQTHDVTGDLTIKGITKSVTVPATVKTEKDMATATATFNVDRTLFDVRFGSKNFFEDLAGDRVINNDIKFDVKVVAKAAAAPAPAKK